MKEKILNILILIGIILFILLFITADLIISDPLTTEDITYGLIILALYGVGLLYLKYGYKNK